MRDTPIYLNNIIMPIYKFLLVFAFLFGFSSILAGIGYGLFTYLTAELSFVSSMYMGFVLFLKGAALSAMISFVGFMAFWKKHQITYLNCKKSKTNNCDELGFFSLA